MIETPGLIARVRAFMSKPAEAWDRAAQETPGGELGGYVIPLALLMTLAGLLGAALAAGFALGPNFIVMEPVAAGLRFLFALLGVLALAKIAQLLAPRFGATGDGARATQWAAYGATGLLIGGLGMLWAPIAPYALMVGAIYSMVLLFLGTTRVLGAPQAKRAGYYCTLLGGAAALLGAGVVAYGAAMDGVRALAAEVAEASAPQAPAEAPAPVLARGAALDANALRALVAQAGEREVDAAVLAGFLPQSLPGGFQRVSLAPEEGRASSAVAAYARDGATLTLTLIALAPGVAPVAIMAAQDGLVARQEGVDYARHQVAEGRLLAESVSGGSIRYALIGRGVALAAEGEGGAAMDDARAAIETIGVGRLEDAFRR